MRIMLTGILAMLVLSACLGSEPEDMTAPGATGSTEAGGIPKASEGDMPASVTTGDVEQRVFLNGAVAEEAEAPNIHSDVKKDSRGKINMVSVDVYQPYPTSLPLQFIARSNRPWEETPLVCRGQVTIEGNPQPLGQMQFVWGKDAQQKRHELKVDVMPALTTIPDSILVVMRTEALLMPIGTDPATVDPATATAPELSSTMLLSNPIRINFHDEPAPGATGEGATEATNEPAAVEPAQTPAAPAQ